MKKLLVAFFAISILSVSLYSCKNAKNEEEAVVSKEDLTAQIQELRKNDVVDMQTGEVDEELAYKLIDVYELYWNNYPDDSMAVYAMSSEAKTYYYLAENREGARVASLLVEKYPDHYLAADACLELGFIYENDIKDFAKAEQYYTLFLTNYPNDERVEDVEMYLKNLGKTPEEIYEEFMNNQDSIQ